MTVTPRVLGDLTGTLQDYFKIGSASNGVRLKTASGVLQIRNRGDSADAGLKASAIQLSASPTSGYPLISDASGNGSWAQLNLAGVGVTGVLPTANTDYSPAVIIAPGSSTRNVIQPSGDFKAAVIKGNASQTVNLTEWQDSSANVLGLVSSIGAATFKPRDSATATVTTALTLGHNSSGTPAASFGTGILFQGQTSTTADTDMATIEAAWTTATHASRAGQLTVNVMDIGTKRQAAIVKINTGVVYWDIGAAGNTNRKFQVQGVGPTMIGSGFFAFDAATTDQTYNALVGNLRVTLSSGIGACSGVQGSMAVTNNTGALTGLLSAVSATSDFRVASTGEIRNAILFQGTMLVRGAGTITNSYGFYLGTPSAQGDSPTWTTNYGIKLFDQVVTSGTGPATSYAIQTGTGLHSFGGGYTKASASGATWDGIALGAATFTLTGSTNVTTATGVNYVTINRPTITDSSSVTVTNAAALYIANAPLAGGSVTITNPYAIWVDAGAARFDGDLDLSAGGQNIILDATTGSKLGTSTSQKLGFWNAAPIVQPTTGVAASTFVANTSGIVNDTATWDGYTIGQVVKALRNMGLLA